jgi:hypothetical protein
VSCTVVSYSSILYFRVVVPLSQIAPVPAGAFFFLSIAIASTIDGNGDNRLAVGC